MENASTPVHDSQFEAIKLPPHSIEAEQSVLGGILLDTTAWNKISDLVMERDFYRFEHRLIFRQLARLAEQAKLKDVTTLAESLESNCDLDKVGGLAYLNLLVRNVPSCSNIISSAKIVRDCAIMRQIAQACSDIATSVSNPGGRNPWQLLDDAENRIVEICEEWGRRKQRCVPMPPFLEKAVERIETLYGRDNASDVTGIATGFTDLDTMTSGLQPGDLIIVAGRPSMGKTTFSINIAEHVALEVNKPVVIFSMEMGGTQLAMRMIGSVGKINRHTLRTGKLEDGDWARMTHALGRLNNAPIFIDETAALNSLELRSRARRLHRQNGGLGLIVIDYIQLMSSTSIKGDENRSTQNSEICRSLKALAKELHVPVIALAKLNRSLEKRPNKRPRMSDLPNAFEQEADLILFIYRNDFYYDDPLYKGMVEIIIGKHRNGPIGKVDLAFSPEYFRFDNVAHSGQYHHGE
jgi:replicative DNA helicase